MEQAKDYFKQELDSQIEIIMNEFKIFKEEEMIYQMVNEDIASLLMRKEQNILDIQEDVLQLNLKISQNEKVVEDLKHELEQRDISIKEWEEKYIFEMKEKYKLQIKLSLKRKDEESGDEESKEKEKSELE